MISTKELKIKKNDDLTNRYIESEFKKNGLDVLRWAITDCDDEYYYLNLAVVED